MKVGHWKKIKKHPVLEIKYDFVILLTAYSLHSTEENHFTRIRKIIISNNQTGKMKIENKKWHMSNLQG